jgi:hypothetical protein
MDRPLRVGVGADELGHVGRRLEIDFASLGLVGQSSAPLAVG